MSFTIVHCEETYRQACKIARGKYQLDILAGRESLSGSTLKGGARSYASRYKLSSQNLIERCQKAGLPIREVIHPHGKRVLEIGVPTPPPALIGEGVGQG